ncbi:MAG: S8 family serine peptidase [Fimbriimonadaceae bacterium]
MEAARFLQALCRLGRAAGVVFLAAGACVGWTAPKCVPGRVLVVFNTPLERGLLKAPNLLGARPVARLGHGEALVLAVPKGADEAAFARQLSRDPLVRIAEPDYLFEPQATPNDPQFPNQWHLAKIQAPQAWDLSKGSQQVVIAIIDSGVDPNHPDLAPKLVPGWNVLNGTSSWADDNGHGTAVAGTAAAATNNAAGVAGVAWDCRIMPVKAAGADGYASSSSLYNGLVWAADNGARVANLSFKVTDNSFVTMGMQHFVSRGGVVTVSAGNDSAQATTPDNPNCLTVVATDSADQKTSWSAYGSNVDLSAPGSSILTTSRGGGYASWAGTSFSAPIVAGAAALLFAANPALTPQDVMQLLKQNADDLGVAGPDNVYGYGRLNVRRALEAATAQSGADEEAPEVSFVSPANGATVSGLATVSVNASDASGIDRVRVLVDGQEIATMTAAPYTLAWDSTRVANGTHTLSAQAYDAHGNMAEAAVSVQVQNADVTPPTVRLTSPADGTTFGNRLTIAGTASDASGIDKVECYINDRLQAIRYTGDFSASFYTKYYRSGWYTVYLKAYDKAGNVAQTPTVRVYKQ